jgi:hypothetical protein
LLPKPEKAVQGKIARIKVNKPVPPAPLHFHSTNIVSLLGETLTGAAFNRLTIAGIKTGTGKVYDVLFDHNGELVKPGEQAEVVQKLATFFEKKLQPATLNGVPCWVHEDKHFIVNNSQNTIYEAATHATAKG